MKEERQLGRVEKFLENLPTSSSESVILLDSEMQSIGASDISPKSNSECSNRVPESCGGSNGKCTNYDRACIGASNAVKCDNFSTVVSLNPCS